MKRILALIVFTCYLSCTKIDTPLTPVKVESAKPKTEFTEILVEFNDEPDIQLIKSTGSSIKHLTKTKTMERFNKKAYHVISVKSTATLEVFRKSPKVKWAEPNVQFNHQGDYTNDLYSLWGMTKIGANITYTEGNRGEQDIYVGIIDEGIFHWHEDLCGQVWSNPYDTLDGIDNDGNGYIDDVQGWDFKNNDNQIFDQLDDHGTHVSGTIAALGNNWKGVVGVSPHVKLISAKFLEDWGTLDAAVQAIDYITDLKVRHKMNIVATNNSWGGFASDGKNYTPLSEAIKRSGDADILFIAAAGNNTWDNDGVGKFMPASDPLPNIISVAAIDRNDNLATFSNYGKTTVHIAAPGVEIYSSTDAYPPNASAYSPYSGTSMATPHVTGAAVLYKAKYPNATASNIKSYLLSTSRKVPTLTDKVITGGVLDVSSLVGHVSKPFQQGICKPGPLDMIPPVSPSNLRYIGTPSNTEAFLKWDLSPSSDVYYYRGLLHDSTGKRILDYILNSENNMKLGEGTLWVLEYGKTYKLSIVAVDKVNNWSLSSNMITININPDKASFEPNVTWYPYNLRYDTTNQSINNACIGPSPIRTFYSLSKPLVQSSTVFESTDRILNGANTGYYSDGISAYWIPATIDYSTGSPIYKQTGNISWVTDCVDGIKVPQDTTVVPPPPPPPPDSRSIVLSGNSLPNKTHVLNWSIKGITPNSITLRDNIGWSISLTSNTTSYTRVTTRKGGSITYTVSGNYTDKVITSNSITLKISR